MPCRHRRIHAQRTGRTEVERVRQERALALLSDTELSMRSIAHRVGFSDERALRRAVRRWHGIHPLAVRDGFVAG
ncbi:helix-turn-helix domain-containing protein [Nocardia sp. NPDC052566]|uniref:helix-turn-helix domain-containing protein n=1 Tax=Nocardia sp. NPDC052566 TaxID=3364330 RepID=UPI0037C67431